jgi:hypothetical protein
MDSERALALARSAFSTSDSYFNTSIRNTMERDIRQVQGLHPSGSKYYSDAYKGRSKLFRPKTRAALRQSEAVAANAYFSTNDVVSIVAEDDGNELQRASAAINQELLNYRLTKTIPWFLVLIGAYQEASTVGVVASLQHWKYDKALGIDKPWIDLIPPENVRIDPACSWLDPVGTSPYVILLMPMYVYEMRERMNAEKGGKWRKVSDEDLRSAVRASDSIRLQREHGRTDSKDQPSDINDFNVVWVHLNFMRYQGVDYCYYTLGDKTLLSEPRKVAEAYPHLQPGERPVVFGRGVVEAHKPYSTSKPSMTRDIQAEINEIANQRIDNVKFAMNKRYFVQRNHQVDLRSLVRNAPSSVTLMNDVEKNVKIVETQDVTSSSYQEQDRLNMDFDDMAGAFSGSSVASNRKLNETVGGMTLLSSTANQIGEYDLKVFNETWVEPVLRQLLRMEQTYEHDEVILALAGNKAKLYQKFGIDTVTDYLLMQELTLNVNVGTGSTNTVNQLERLLYALQSLQKLLGPQAFTRLKVDEIIKEVFGKIGYKDGGRFYMSEGENPEIDSLLQQIEELTAALNAKNPPEVIAAQVEELRARAENLRAKTVKEGVTAIYSAMQTGATIAQAPAIAPVGDKVMEAAGYQYPNPAGVDPNIPAPTTLDAGGINASMPPVRLNTSPTQPPVAPSPMKGIETQEMGMGR